MDLYFYFWLRKGKVMKVKEIVKLVASAATGIGVGKTVDLVLKDNLPGGMTWKTRLATFIGSAVISGYISTKCSKYVEEEIDQVADIVDKIKNSKHLEVGEVEIEIKEDGE